MFKYVKYTSWEELVSILTQFGLVKEIKGNGGSVVISNFVLTPIRSDYEDYSALVDNELYNAGYRRQVELSEIEEAFHSYHDQFWLNDWLHEKFAELGTFTKLKKFLATECGLYPSCIGLCSETGLPYPRNMMRSYDIGKNGKVLTKLIYSFKKEDFYNLGRFYVRRDEFFDKDHTFSNGSGYEYHLYSIIWLDFDICEEHEDSWFERGRECPKCASESKIHYYSTNVSKLLKWHDGGESNPMYMGVELEYDTKQILVKNVYKALPDFVLCKEDGSIRGYEVVTAPAIFSVHKEKFKDFPWEEQVVSKATGMHVHVNRASLSELQLGKIYSLIYNDENKNWIKIIAGRDFASNAYCSTVIKKTVVSGVTCYDEGVTRNIEGSHSTAINVSNKNTIEFRIFKSPQNYAEFMSRLEFVKALCDYTKPGAVALSISKFKDKEPFFEFVKQNKTSYPNLSEIMEI